MSTPGAEGWRVHLGSISVCAGDRAAKATPSSLAGAAPDDAAIGDAGVVGIAQFSWAPGVIAVAAATAAVAFSAVPVTPGALCAAGALSRH